MYIVRVVVCTMVRLARARRINVVGYMLVDCEGNDCEKIERVRGRLEKRRKGDVSLNAWIQVKVAASAAIEKRIVLSDIRDPEPQ